MRRPVEALMRNEYASARRKLIPQEQFHRSHVTQVRTRVGGCCKEESFKESDTKIGRDLLSTTQLSGSSSGSIRSTCTSSDRRVSRILFHGCTSKQRTAGGTCGCTLRQWEARKDRSWRRLTNNARTKKRKHGSTCWRERTKRQ